MQIRERGGKVEFLRSVYSKEDKRCTMKLIGSADRHSRTFPAKLMEKLNESEQAEASTWLETRITAETAMAQKCTVRGAAVRLNDLAAAIGVTGLDVAQAQAIQEAWKLVQKAIRKAVKPAKEAKAPTEPAADLVAGGQCPKCKSGLLAEDRTTGAISCQSCDFMRYNQP